ncbi:hypothetical protein [Aerococcus vaginalis]
MNAYVEGIDKAGSYEEVDALVLVKEAIEQSAFQIQFGMWEEMLDECEALQMISDNIINELTQAGYEELETITIVKDAAADYIAGLHFDAKTKDDFFERIDKAGSYTELLEIVADAQALASQSDVENEQPNTDTDEDSESEMNHHNHTGHHHDMMYEHHRDMMMNPHAQNVVSQSTDKKEESVSEANAASQLPQTNFASAGLGLAMALVGVGSAFAFKKKR